MRYSVDKIDAAAAFRLTFFIVLVIGGFLGLVFLVVSFFIDQLLLGLLTFVLFIPLSALILAGLVALKAVIYSAFARRFGGIVVDLEKAED